MALTWGTTGKKSQKWLRRLLTGSIDRPKETAPTDR